MKRTKKCPPTCGQMCHIGSDFRHSLHTFVYVWNIRMWNGLTCDVQVSRKDRNTFDGNSSLTAVSPFSRISCIYLKKGKMIWYKLRQPSGHLHRRSKEEALCKTSSNASARLWWSQRGGQRHVSNVVINALDGPIEPLMRSVARATWGRARRKRWC